jgi:hypothetical protein
MERRSLALTVTENVAAAIERSNETLITISQATDIPVSGLRERLANRVEFTMSEIGRVGGFFRIHPADLLESAK